MTYLIVVRYRGLGSRRNQKLSLNNNRQMENLLSQHCGRHHSEPVSGISNYCLLGGGKPYCIPAISYMFIATVPVGL